MPLYLDDVELQGCDLYLKKITTAGVLIANATGSAGLVSRVAMTSGQLLIGSSGGIPTAVTPSQDVSVSNTGAFTVLGATGSFYLAGVVSPTDTGTNHNYSPTGLSTASTLVLGGSGPITITGLTGGATGRIMVIKAVTNSVTIHSENASSTAANRFVNPFTFNPLYLSPNESAVYQYFSSRWNLIAVNRAELVDPGVNDYRLSSSSSASVNTADVTAGTTIYLAEHRGNLMALYNTNISGFRLYRDVASASHSLSGVAVGMYDMFAYADSNGQIALERLVWTNTTTRATSITRVGGIWVKSTDFTRRYLGSFYVLSTGAYDDRPAYRGLWNVDNQVQRSVKRLDNVSHNYNTSATREWSGGNTTRCYIVNGVDGGSIFSGTANILWLNSASPTAGIFNIGYDGTGTLILQVGRCDVSVAGVSFPAGESSLHSPGVGLHYYCLTENGLGAGGTSTWQLGGLSGSITG